MVKLGPLAKTKFELEAPVVPGAEKPVMLLKAVMLGELTAVPPFATERGREVTNKLPDAVDWTNPAPKEVIVVEPATTKV